MTLTTETHQAIIAHCEWEPGLLLSDYERIRDYLSMHVSDDIDLERVCLQFSTGCPVILEATDAVDGIARKY